MVNDTDDRLAAQILRLLEDNGFEVQLADEQVPVVAQCPSPTVPGLMITGEGTSMYLAVVHLAKACGLDIDQ